MQRGCAAPLLSQWMGRPIVPRLTVPCPRREAPVTEEIGSYVTKPVLGLFRDRRCTATTRREGSGVLTAGGKHPFFSRLRPYTLILPVALFSPPHPALFLLFITSPLSSGANATAEASALVCVSPLRPMVTESRRTLDQIQMLPAT